MQNHVRTYTRYFGYTMGDFIPCEYCGSKSCDVHHITPRSIAKKSFVNKIDNLAAVCRGCHDKAHASKEFNEELRAKHIKNVMACTRDNESIKYLKPDMEKTKNKRL